jgi:hypothetical protein
MAVSSQQIVDFLIANPNMSDAEIASVMNQFGVSPSDVAAATGADEAVVQARFDEVAPTVAAPIDEPVAAPVYEAPTAPVYEAPATPVVAPVAAPTGQISTQQIVDFLATNPTNAEIGKAMETFKVSPTQIADALASQEAKLGATTTVVENAETGQTSSVLNDLGGGFNAYRDENGNLSYSRVDPANPDKIQLYGPKGEYRGEEKILSSGEQVWKDLGPIVKAVAGQYAGQVLSDSGVLKDLFGNVVETAVPTDAVPSTPFSADYSLTNGINPEGLKAGTSANLPTMGGGQGITLNVGAPSTTLADAIATIGGVGPTNLTTMGGGQGLTLQTPTGLVTSTGTIPIGGLTGNTNVIGATGINTATNIGSTIGSTIPVNPLAPPKVPVVPAAPPAAKPPVVTPTTPLIPPTIAEVIKTIAPIAIPAIVATAVTPKTPTKTGYDVVPIPTDWKPPTAQPTTPFQPLAPIDFGTSALLKGTQFERMLDPNYGKVPAPTQYAQPSNLSYNDLMSILGSKQGMPPTSSLSINDVISGIQNQYGQVPSGAVGAKPA